MPDRLWRLCPADERGCLPYVTCHTSMMHVTSCCLCVAARACMRAMADSWAWTAARRWLSCLALIFRSDGWTWSDEGRNKWGWVSEEPGAVLELRVPALLPHHSLRNNSSNISSNSSNNNGTNGNGSAHLVSASAAASVLATPSPPVALRYYQRCCLNA